MAAPDQGSPRSPRRGKPDAVKRIRRIGGKLYRYIGKLLFVDLTISQTEAALKQQMGNRKFDAAIVSPGGERLAWTAAIMNDTHRAAARGGSLRP